MYAYAFFLCKGFMCFRAWILVVCFMFVNELTFWLGYDVQGMKVVIDVLLMDTDRCKCQCGIKKQWVSHCKGIWSMLLEMLLCPLLNLAH